MLIVYSCVVDQKERFNWQCRIFVETLLKNAKVVPENIVVHVVGVQERLCKYLKWRKVTVVHVEEYGIGKYCNKLVQFETEKLKEADFVFLCDCDIAFGESLEKFIDGDSIIAKNVDSAQPPVEKLESLFKRFKCTVPDRTKVFWGETFSTYCNGGVIGIPKKLFGPLGKKWKKLLSGMLSDLEVESILGKNLLFCDQISFSIAVSELRCSLKRMTAHFNAPSQIMPWIDSLEKEFQGIPPSAIHYHASFDEFGFLRRVGGRIFDKAIDRVNAALLSSWREEGFEKYLEIVIPAFSYGEFDEHFFPKKICRKIHSQLLGGEMVSLQGTGSLAFVNREDAFYAAKSLKSKDNVESFYSKIKKAYSVLRNEQTTSCVVCFDTLENARTECEYRTILNKICELPCERLLITGFEHEDQINRKDGRIDSFYGNLRDHICDFKKFHSILKLGVFDGTSIFLADTKRGILSESLNAVDRVDHSLSEAAKLVSYFSKNLSQVSAHVREENIFLLRGLEEELRQKVCVCCGDFVLRSILECKGLECCNVDASVKKGIKKGIPCVQDESFLVSDGFWQEKSSDEIQRVLDSFENRGVPIKEAFFVQKWGGDADEHTALINEKIKANKGLLQLIKKLRVVGFDVKDKFLVLSPFEKQAYVAGVVASLVE